MQNEKVKTLTYMAVMMALAMVATISVRIPVPATQGYVHFGDTVLILSVLVLGKKKGAVAGALGQALADILGGYVIFAPVTFVAKLLMGLLVGMAVESIIKYKSEKNSGKIVLAVFFAVLSCVAMVGSYYLAESMMYGSFIVPLAEIPANIIQFSAGAILATAVGGMLVKTPAKALFSIGKQ